jgi:hypothetical protein
MIDKRTPAPDNFTCPLCKSKLPKRKIFMMIWRKRYNCDKCHSVLTPRLNERGVTGLVIEGFASIATIGIVSLLAPVIGFTAVLCVIIIIHTLGLHSSITFYSHNIRFTPIDDFSSAALNTNALHDPLFTQHNCSGNRAEEIEWTIGGFMCPSCRYKFPARKAILLNRWTRCTCPQCQSILAPVIREVEISGAAGGLLGAGGGTLIPMIVKPIYGYWGVLVGMLLFIIIALFLATYVSVNYIHFERAQK